MYSIYLGLDKINKIVKNEKNIFFCYSDINWKWNKKIILKKLKNSKSAIFTHKGFHPHLEVNSKSDFCLNKGSRIIQISEKKTFKENYRNELLAIGCYFVKELNLVNNFFKNFKFRNKKEYYLTSFINYLLLNKVLIKKINVSKFVHLGMPSQYEDYLKWQKYNLEINTTNKKNKYSVVMLMGGKGKRLSKITHFKPFLDINGKPIFKLIFDKLYSKEKFIITNNNYKKKLSKRFKLVLIKKTNSMFNSIYQSHFFLKSKSKYFLTSCDCFGLFDDKKFNFIIDNSDNDLVIFAFKFSNLQKKLGNAHTQLTIENNKITKIKVKSNFRESNYGHGGFFWVNSDKVFDYLDHFKHSYFYKNINREVLIDDYFRFLLMRKFINISYVLLDDYVHIGSEKEYLEHKYWNNYFHEKKFF